MDCQTVKAGNQCIFMKASGCSFNGGSCHPVTEKCEGCDNIIEYSAGQYCRISPDPSAKWSLGLCNFATHIKKDMATEKHKVNPLKASKRRGGK